MNNYHHKFDVNRLATETADAPAAKLFNSWKSVCRLLANADYNSWEAEAILRSDWAVRAATNWTGAGKPTSGALDNFLYANGIESGCEKINDLVMQTFGKEYKLELNENGVPCQRGNSAGGTGASILVPLGTPACCDPTTETYWSM